MKKIYEIHRPLSPRTERIYVLERDYKDTIKSIDITTKCFLFLKELRLLMNNATYTYSCNGFFLFQVASKDNFPKKH
ncbi:hypothetical protein ABEB36_004120 [Hypothenemus hampei]|uniref:Uncharacterized protein n=1 Tax=Hypothenemus hampei TaxID=57062 RepID=A0ABD1F287_HYPHA